MGLSWVTGGPTSHDPRRRWLWCHEPSGHFFLPSSTNNLLLIHPRADIESSSGDSVTGTPALPDCCSHGMETAQRGMSLASAIEWPDCGGGATGHLRSVSCPPPEGAWTAPFPPRVWLCPSLSLSAAPEVRALPAAYRVSQPQPLASQ